MRESGEVPPYKDAAGRTEVLHILNVEYNRVRGPEDRQGHALMVSSTARLKAWDDKQSLLPLLDNGVSSAPLPLCLTMLLKARLGERGYTFF